MYMYIYIYIGIRRPRPTQGGARKGRKWKLGGVLLFRKRFETVGPAIILFRRFWGIRPKQLAQLPEILGDSAETVGPARILEVGSKLGSRSRSRIL